MGAYDDRENFIPYRKSEVVELLVKDGKLQGDDVESFKNFCKVLESLYHFEFHEKIEVLKENYYPFNPDKDTKPIKEFTEDELKECEKTLVEKFQEVLENANFEQIQQADLEHAMDEESLFKVSLFVDFEDFDSQLIFWRGDFVKTVKVKKFFFKEVEVEVPTFERVAMLIKFKDEEYFKNKKRGDLLFEPGGMVIKLFKNIPKADLEMLFPNTQVQMKPKDKAIMGLSGIGGGVGVLAAKGAAIAVFFIVLGKMVLNQLGFDVNYPTAAEMTAMVGGVAALGAVGGFVFKQYSNYKNRKILFMKTLADSLYFKNLDNNAGVFHHIIDAAEEEECKEAVLGYYFLLQNPEGLTEQALDDLIEAWFEKNHNTLIDFEVDDALGKLKRLELAQEAGQNEKGETIYKVLPMEKACERLDYIWDNYFDFNKG